MCMVFEMQKLQSTRGHVLLVLLLVLDLVVSLQNDVEVRQTRQTTRFQFNATPLSWPGAYQACRALNGSLAVPRTSDDAFLLAALLDENAVPEAHVGFHDTFVEGVYVSLRGLRMDEMGYHRGLSTTPTPGAGCGRFHADVGYQSVECAHLLPSVCQLPRGEPGEFVLIPEFGYYKRHKEMVYWRAALLACRAEDAHLIVVRSEAEYRALSVVFAEVVTLYWTHYGAHHTFRDNDFETIFGEPLNNSGYAIWTPGYPGEWTNVEMPCLVMTVASNNKYLGFGLGSATMPRGFICKRELH